MKQPVYKISHKRKRDVARTTIQKNLEVRMCGLQLKKISTPIGIVQNHLNLFS